MPPKLHFFGSSFAARHLSDAAVAKGCDLVDAHEADVVFVSEDTPTSADGVRDLDPIRRLIEKAVVDSAAPIVLTSQVPPGFTRKLSLPYIFHQAETLRIKDAAERAANPEMIIVGCADTSNIPESYRCYLRLFNCPIIACTWEEAEFAKIAINVNLISQVKTTNLLSKTAEKIGARWMVIAEILRHDSRIGPKAYLDRGQWYASPHLLRDFVTLTELSESPLLEAWRP